MFVQRVGGASGVGGVERHSLLAVPVVSEVSMAPAALVPPAVFAAPAVFATHGVRRASGVGGASGVDGSDDPPRRRRLAFTPEPE
jgi:hypothetical protein